MRLYDGKVVLVTGGTMGIGLATALAFGRHGAQTVITHRWGSADEDEVIEQFVRAEAPEPLIVEADILRSEDTSKLFATILQQYGRLDALISNASAAVTVQSLDDLTERAFLRSMRATAWPTVEYTLAAKRELGAYPRYVVVMSSSCRRMDRIGSRPPTTSSRVGRRRSRRWRSTSRTGCAVRACA